LSRRSLRLPKILVRMLGIMDLLAGLAGRKNKG
jgi:hypothetical protein